jgi:hypothetical protein
VLINSKRTPDQPMYELADWQQPVTNADDWCGEFKPAEGEK